MFQNVECVLGKIRVGYGMSVINFIFSRSGDGSVEGGFIILNKQVKQVLLRLYLSEELKKVKSELGKDGGRGGCFMQRE